MGKIIKNSAGKVLSASGGAFEVTAAIDSNIAAGNIKSGVTILGVEGTYGGSSPNLTSLSVTPTTSAQQLTPTSPVDGYNQVNVSAVTSAIDSNIVAGNIKKDVSILGVTGTYEGSGGSGSTNQPTFYVCSASSNAKGAPGPPEPSGTSVTLYASYPALNSAVPDYVIVYDKNNQINCGNYIFIANGGGTNDDSIGNNISVSCTSNQAVLSIFFVASGTTVNASNYEVAPIYLSE